MDKAVIRKNQSWPFVWKAISRLALLAFGTVLALIITEVALQLIIPSKSGAISGDLNPWVQYVGWAGNPYQVRVNTNFKTVIQYNSKGLRDVEHTYEKPPETFRILILGDSFVEAEQIGDLEKTFPRLLEELLNQRHQTKGVKFEVIAASASGWGTDQHLLYYQHEGYKYQPDLVLLSFTSNDVADSFVPWRMINTGWPEGCVYKPYFDLENDRLVLHNFPYYFQKIRAIDEPDPADALSLLARFKNYLYDKLHIYRLAVNVAQERPSSRITKVLAGIGFMPVTVEEKPGRCQQMAATQGDAGVTLYVYYAQYSEEEEKAWSLEKALIRELKSVTKSQGIPLVIVANAASSPTGSIQQGKALYTDAEGVQWDWEKVNRLMATICQEENVPFLALEPTFVQSPSAFEDLFIPGDGHYNLGGHRLAAETIYDWLVEQTFVP